MGEQEQEADVTSPRERPPAGWPGRKAWEEGGGDWGGAWAGGLPVTPRTRRVVCRYPSAGAAGPSSGAEARYGLPWRGRELRSFCLKVRGSAVWKAQEGSGVRGGK